MNQNKFMIRFAALVLALLMLVPMTACGSTGSSGSSEKDLLARIQERGSIVIATEGDWAPWTYHDDSDALVGIDVELGRLIAEGLGVEVEFAETDWDSILAGVSSGRFDIACNGVDYTEERAQSYLFSTPYIYTQEALVVRSDNEDIHSIDDLAGKKTSNSPNSTYAQIAEEAGAELVYVNTLAETMMVLERGDADATINAKVSIDEYLRQHPDANIKIVYVSEGTSVCIPTQNSDDAASLMAAIDAILSELRETGKLSELSMKYFGVDLTAAP